jgi:hypothetical protein
MRLLLLLSFLTSTFITHAQPISNHSFENWHNAYSVLVPDSFRTQDQIMTTSTPTVSRSNESHSGQYAVAVQNVYLSPGVGMSGQLHYGSMTNNGGAIQFFGWPCNDRPTAIAFWYKFLRNGTDTAQASVTLTKWNGTQRETVGRGIINITATTNTYTQAVVQISYFSGQSPDSVTISFVSGSNLVPTPGTTLYVDDISFNDLANSVSKQPFAFGTVIYPNPATGISTVKFSYSGMKLCTLFDQTGKKRGEFTEAGLTHQVDLYNLKSGIYFLNIQNDGRDERMIILRE